MAESRQPEARLTARVSASVETQPTLTRWLLAGPGAVVASLLFVMAMPVWLPEGAASVDHVVWPQVLAPLIWAVACVYACLAEDLARCVYLQIGVIVVCGLLSGLAVMGWM